MKRTVLSNGRRGSKMRNLIACSAWVREVPNSVTNVFVWSERIGKHFITSDAHKVNHLEKKKSNNSSATMRLGVTPHLRISIFVCAQNALWNFPGNHKTSLPQSQNLQMMMIDVIAGDSIKPTRNVANCTARKTPVP